MQYGGDIHKKTVSTILEVSGASVTLYLVTMVNSFSCCNCGRTFKIWREQVLFGGYVENVHYSFAFDASTVWNDLPDDVCSFPTVTCFRKRLKSYLFDNAFLH